MSTRNYLEEFKYGFFLLFFVIAVSTSCDKTFGEVQIVDSKVFKELVLISQRSDLFIDSIKSCTGKIEVYLSNKEQIIGYFPKIDFLSLGADGYWYNYEERTSSLSDSTSAEEILSFQIGENGDLLAISEGYENWTFHFKGEPSITILKSLFAIDYDKILLTINHRGYNVEAPENTLPAFRLSRLNGFRYVETDIRFTSDGEPVLLHDPSIDRTSNGNGLVSDMCLSQLKQYDFGGWKSPDYLGITIPTLDEFLSLCKCIGLHPVLELKTGNANQVSLVIEKVKQYGLEDDTVFISFSSLILKYVLQKEPEAKISYLTSQITDDTIKIALDLQKDNPSLVINSKDYREEAIDKCKSAKLPLWVWTINTKEELKSLSSYISAVTSDRIHAGRLIFENR